MREIIQSQPLYQQTYKAIKEAILKGEIKLGTEIIATKLAENFGVGRTPLREALRQLTNEGLLVQNYASLNVVSLNQQDFEELLHCRLVLEKEIIRLGTPHIKQEEINEADSYLELSKKAFQKKIGYEVLEYNTNFHAILIKACPNRRLVQLIEKIRLMLLIYRANILHYHDYNSEIFEEHKEILDAVKERDVEKATQKVEYHLLQDLQRGKKIIELEITE